MPMTSTRRFDNTLGGTQRQEQCRRHFGGEPVGSHQWSSFSASATNTAVTVKQQYHSQRNQYSSPAAVPQSRQRSQRRQLATSPAVRRSDALPGFSEAQQFPSILPRTRDRLSWVSNWLCIRGRMQRREGICCALTPDEGLLL